MRVAIGLALVTLVSAGCSATRVPAAFKRGSNWTLTRVDLDRSALQSPERRFPTFPPPGKTSFGRVPTADGTLGVSQDGHVIVRVVLYEPIPRSEPFRYLLLDYKGWLDDDRRTIVNPSLTQASLSPIQATHLLLSTTDRGEVRIQGAYGDALHPYVFTFAPRPARTTSVAVPFL